MYPLRERKYNSMKMRKVFGACALLLALTVVGCNGGNSESSASQNTNKPTTSQPNSNKPTTTSAAPASTTTSAAPAENPLLTPLVRNYTEGQAVKNSSDKDYIPLTDATANKVGVKIAMANWEVATFEGATATAVLASDGGIEPKNDHNAFIAFKVKAPKAGNYQMVVSGKGSSSGEGKTLSDRAFAVKLNGEDVEVEGDREPINSSDYTAFVAAPTMALRGPEQEDIIALSCSDYRIKFDTASFVIFNEI